MESTHKAEVVPEGILDFPKLESPFEREKDAADNYFCIPKIKDEHRWVFSPEAVAVDKLDGTGTSVLVQNGQIIGIFNRANRIQLFTKNSLRFYEGVVNAIDRHHFIPGFDGQAFGELIGPKIRGNPYSLKEYRWEPFAYLKKKYRLKFWPKFTEELAGKSDTEIFGAVSGVFKELWSIYKLSLGFDKAPVTKDTKFEGVAAEGLVFYSPYGEMAKLRRDMFPWYRGASHKKSGACS